MKINTNIPSWFPKKPTAEGHKEILELCGLTSWDSILYRRRKKPGFDSLFKRNPSNGKPFILISEYFAYLFNYNDKK